MFVHVVVSGPCGVCVRPFCGTRHGNFHDRAFRSSFAVSIVSAPFRGAFAVSFYMAPEPFALDAVSERTAHADPF